MSSHRQASGASASIPIAAAIAVQATSPAVDSGGAVAAEALCINSSTCRAAGLCKEAGTVGLTAALRRSNSGCHMAGGHSRASCKTRREE